MSFARGISINVDDDGPSLAMSEVSFFASDDSPFTVGRYFPRFPLLLVFVHLV